ncbi:MAG: protein kinase [Candidatus Cloacimonadota bacterium]|nr:protein kinase [Candidatus Cloacimonadota bacterium]
MSIKALHYKVIEKIQEGQISTVYKVKDVATDELLALKIFTHVEIEDIKISLNPDVMFEITRISHPNLISVYDYGIYNDQFYLLSEFGYSQSLCNFELTQHTQKDFLDIAVQICYALDYLHKNHLLHKDLKLENALYRWDDYNNVVVKVCDFGFNKIISTEETYTEVEKTNLPYCAPEVLQKAEYSKKSDFYSLGILLYRLAVGNFPFTQEEIKKISRGEIANIIPQFPQTEQIGLDKAMQELISNLIFFNKEARPDSSREIIEFINRNYQTNYSVIQDGYLLKQIESRYFKIRTSDIEHFQKFVEINLEEKKGSLILFSGDTGVGKRQTMQYLKWFLLSSNSYVIYYNCNEIHRDPFFMLTKEIFLTKEQQGKNIFLQDSSDRLKKFLFDSESAALEVEEDEKSLKKDFRLVKEYLYNYSKEKPIFFFISNILKISQETVDFIKYLSEDISEHNMLIAFSSPEEDMFQDINNLTKIPIKFLTNTETNIFIKELLDADVSQELGDELFYYSNGNQLIIKQILIQLLRKGVIKQVNSQWRLKNDVQEIEIPDFVKSIIKSKIEKIAAEDIQNLSRLAILQTPISKELIKYILKFKSKKQVFFFIERCKQNNILVLHEKYFKEGYYKFIYPWVKEKLAENVSANEKKKISEDVVNYFYDKRLDDPAIMNSIIEHCLIAGNDKALVDYKLIIINHHIERRDFISAWQLSHDMMPLISELRDSLTKEKLVNYLTIYLHLSGIIEKYKPKEFKGFYDLIQKDFNLLILDAEQFYNMDYIEAHSILKKAEKIADPSEFTQIQLAYLKLYQKFDKVDDAKKIFNSIDISTFNNIEKAEYTYHKGSIQYLSSDFKASIESLFQAIEEAKRERENVKSSSSHFTSKIYPNDLLFAFHSSPLFILSQIYAKLADVYNMTNKVVKANEYYLKSIENSIKSGNTLTLAGAYCEWALMLNKTGELDKAIRKLHNSKYHYNEIQNKQGLANVNLQIAQINFKMGEFQESNKYFEYALQLSIETGDKEFIKKIKEKYSFLYFKISFPYQFHKYLMDNYLEYFEEDSILQINSFIKNYIFSLEWYGDSKKTSEMLKSIKKHKVDCTLEEEFILQTEGFIAKTAGNYPEAERLFKKALSIATENKNNYAVMIEHFNIAETLYKLGKLKQAQIQCKFGRAIAEKNSFNRWINFAGFVDAEIGLKNKDINLRIVIRTLRKCLQVSKEMKDWMISLKALALIIFAYRSFKSPRKEMQYRNEFDKLLELALQNLNETDQELLKEHFLVKYVEGEEKIDKFIEPRVNPSAYVIQHRFFDLLQHTDLKQIKFNIKRMIANYLGAHKFEISVFDEKTRKRRIWFDGGFDSFKKYHEAKIDLAKKSQQTQYYKFNNVHYCHTPLFLKNELIGILSLCDDAEMHFKYAEKKRIKISSFYLAVILKKMDEFQLVLKQREQVTNLLSISRDILQIMDLDIMKNRITENAIQLTAAEKGFFLSVDENENFIFDVGLLKNGDKIEKRHFEIKTDIIREVYQLVLSKSDSTFTPDQLYFSIREGDRTISIFCAPLSVNNKLFGFVYLEGSYGDIRNIEFKLLEIFALMSENAIKNCIDYEKLQDANEKLLEIDYERAQFINISSHEFNTPVQILKGYIKILKDKNSSEKLKENSIRIMENNINRLSYSLNNVLQMNALGKTDFLINQEVLDVKDLLEIVYDEMGAGAESRKQKLILELPADLRPIKAERISLLNAIKNLVLNSIRFTEDYGEITIGARRSRFKKEEVNNIKTTIIYVKDNGLGIPSYELDNIFKEFYEVADIKAHHSGIMEFKSAGLGLGLPLTKSIIEMFGGKIWVKSIKGEGSTFYIALPEVESKE